MSRAAAFRASVRRNMGLPPLWASRARQRVMIAQDWPDAPLPEMEVVECGGCAPPVLARSICLRAPSSAMVVTAVETPAVRLAREFGMVKAALKPDYARYAEAAKARPVAKPAAAPRPTQVALSPEECKRCGIPGWKGCDHQLPYEEWTPAAQRGDAEKFIGHHKRKGRRHGGIQAVRI